MTTTQIRAPFTSEQVTALNRWQTSGPGHPFTCGSTHATGRSPVLDATHSGWICPDPACSFTQDWAHGVMASPGEWAQLTALPGVWAAATPTPCSIPECDTDGTGEPCDRHEIEQAHAAGEHEFCGVACEAKFPTEQLRAFILAKGYPGTAGMLAELERRAAAPPATLDELRQEMADALAARDAQTRAQALREAADDLTADADALERDPGPLPNNFARGLRQAADRLRSRADGIHRSQP